MSPRARPYTPLPITWLPGIPSPIAPAPPAPKPLELRVLPQLGLLAIALSLISLAAYWSGRNSLSATLDQTQSELKLQQLKAKELNDQLYDAQQALQNNQQAALQVQAIRAIVCPETGGP
jgi:hypothetical protein